MEYKQAYKLSRKLDLTPYLQQVISYPNKHKTMRSWGQKLDYHTEMLQTKKLMLKLSSTTLNDALKAD